MITATLNDYRQSPRKVRSVANVIKGKTVTDAMNACTFIGKSAGLPLKKLIASAIANATHNFKIEPTNLVVKDLRVDGGPILYRRMPRARGSANPIRKRTSHITLVLEEITPKAKKVRKIADKKVTEKVEVKKS
ncbi:MAG: 50S ribosomal protein L22 [Candidatus Paceibacterota bacterium]|jgi:large subunit ribosomal protein L22